MTRRAGLTLIETLSTLVVVTVIISAGGRLFRDGWVVLHRTIRYADDHQAVTLLMRRWQQEIGKTDPATWEVTPHRFRAAALSIVHEGDQLLFRMDGRTQATHTIGAKACTFAIEKHSGAADCAVLTIGIPSARAAGRQAQPVRIVACGDSA